MKAARYHGPGERLFLEEVKTPTPGPGEVLVRVRAAGVCHTELHFLSGLLNLGIAPLTLGHEVAGEVVAVGPGVTDIASGERVVIYYYVSCRRCCWCRTNRANLCPNLVAEYGFTADGGYAEYIKVPAGNVVKLPETLEYDAAATLGCSATTALHAARTIANVSLGETVVVYGVGGVGYALVQVCRLAGARVIAVGRSDAKLAVARELGADHVVNALHEEVPQRVKRLTDGEGADVVFELVGIKTTMGNSLNSLRKRGRLVFIGYSSDPFVANTLHLVVDELQVLASVGNTLQELVDAVELARLGRIKPVIAGAMPLEAVNTALQSLAKGEVVGRVVLHP